MFANMVVLYCFYSIPVMFEAAWYQASQPRFFTLLAKGMSLARQVPHLFRRLRPSRASMDRNRRERSVGRVHCGFSSDASVDDR